ncbi:SCF ubiquitin ligase complex subunit cdc4 [Haplosporangium sp. Z 27]|nr:SCF ubiquitin ligase complex subunit cdc4 [Haplosporangium sp. Z 27]
MGGVWALEFVKGVGPTGDKILVSGGCDREVRVWDMNTGRCREVMPGHTGTIRCLKLHQLPSSVKKNTTISDQNNANDENDTLGKRPQQQQQQLPQHIAITGSRDATLRVWDIQTGTNLFVLQGHRDSVRCIEVHEDKLVSGSYDCTARVWSLVTGECLLLLQGHFQQIYSIAFNGKYIITGSLDSTCRLWSPITGACMATLQGHTQLVGQLQLSGDSLMTGGGDGYMYMWNLNSMVCQYRVQAHEQSVTSLCFDSKRIVTGGNDGAVKLWDRQTGRFIRDLTTTDASIWRVAICEERVVMCMQRSGRTVTEIMCFDSEAPVIPQDGLGSSTYSMGATAATVMHDQQRLWESDRIKAFEDLRI